MSSRVLRHLLGAALLLTFAAVAPAQAAPVARPVNLTLTVVPPGPGLRVLPTGAYVRGFTATAPGSVSVDSAAQQLGIASLAVSLSSSTGVIVDGSTAIASVSAFNLRNLSGVFSPGGAARGEPPCTGPPTGGCVPGGGFGGTMGLAGTVLLQIIRNVVVIPLEFPPHVVGRGGTSVTSPDSFFFDGAPWTTAAVGSIYTIVGSALEPAVGSIDPTGSRLTLVSPTFVQALGNQLPVFSFLTIEFTDGGGLPGFVPEPTPVLLVASGLWLLVALVRRRGC